MASTNDRRSEAAAERPAATNTAPAEVRHDSPAPPAEQAFRPGRPAGVDSPGAPAPSASHGTPPRPSEAAAPTHALRKWLLLGVILAGLAVAGYFLVPWVITTLNTVSTDDAYVNSHVTFLAPRVGGQVKKVFVDDNYRVKAGDLLVQLDKEPYQVQVQINQAAVTSAEADLVAAQAQVRALVAQARSNRFRLEHAIEDVNTQLANLRASVATLSSRKATLELARANRKRGEELDPSGGISKEDLDQRRQTVKVDEAAVEQAAQAVYAIRV